MNMFTRVQTIADADINIKKLEHKRQRLQKEASAAERKAKSLLETHPWISTERQYFGRPGTDYDFTLRDPKDAAQALKKLEQEQAALSKRVNKKVCPRPL